MVEIDIQVEVTKYQAQLDGFVKQLREIEEQRVQFVQAIQERRGILAFLSSLKDKE